MSIKGRLIGFNDGYVGKEGNITFYLGDKLMKKLMVLFIILLFAVFSCASVSQLRIAEKPTIGSGFSHKKQAPFLLTIPAGHPDFTMWPIVEYKNVTPEVTILRFANPGQGCYRIVVCEHEPIALALWHSCGAEDFFWIYKDKVPVEVTEEEFKKKLTEAQYLCPEIGQEV